MPPSASPVVVYIGTYTEKLNFVDGKAEGLYIARLDPASGALTIVDTVTGLANPSYLVLDAAGRTLYVTSESPEGTVTAFAVDPATGGLTRLNSQLSHGVSPCYLSIDATGRWLFVANYRSGTVAVLPIHADGRLGEAADVVQHEGSSVHPVRQTQAHAHWIQPDPDNRFVLAVDLGMDRALVYRFDVSSGKLRPNDPPGTALPPGAGPRHIVYHPAGPYVYLVNELANTVVTFAYDAAAGTLEMLESLSTLPDDWSGASACSALRIARDGRFVYASNRGHDSIAVFAVGGDGRLTRVAIVASEGEVPRDFNIDASGTLLLAANQNSDTIVAFRIDAASGVPEPTGVSSRVLTPACIVFGK